jgi:LDH2 family malate/lactate/ureidoglycolate dehydrogenase
MAATRGASGIPVDDTTWNQIAACAQALHVQVPKFAAQ